jgi:hypothetical protein
MTAGHVTPLVRPGPCANQSLAILKAMPRQLRRESNHDSQNVQLIESTDTRDSQLHQNYIIGLG